MWRRKLASVFTYLEGIKVVFVCHEIRFIVSSTSETSIQGDAAAKKQLDFGSSERIILERSSFKTTLGCYYCPPTECPDIECSIIPEEWEIPITNLPSALQSAG